MKTLFALLLFTVFAHANLNVIASILPEQALVQSVGGNKVTVSLMVKPGNSPHTYEPKPSQMREISRADLYLAIGVEFEEVWLPRFRNQNREMKIIDISRGIKKLAISGEDEKEGEHHDPHIWTAPPNIKIIAKHILSALTEADPVNRDYYQKNYRSLITKAEETDRSIVQLLQALPAEKRTFIVFHPSWGYFAKTYGLTQIPIEIDGKAPKPRAIQKLIQEAKKRHIHTILTSPEFSDAIAKQIAGELDVKILKISPLDPHWQQNLIRLAKTIAGS